MFRLCVIPGRDPGWNGTIVYRHTQRQSTGKKKRLTGRDGHLGIIARRWAGLGARINDLLTNLNLENIKNF